MRRGFFTLVLFIAAIIDSSPHCLRLLGRAGERRTVGAGERLFLVRKLSILRNLSSARKITCAGRVWMFAGFIAVAQPTMLAFGMLTTNAGMKDQYIAVAKPSGDASY